MLAAFTWLNLFVLSAIFQSLALFMFFFISCQVWVLGIFVYRWYLYFQSKHWKPQDIKSITSSCHTMYQNSAPRTTLNVAFSYVVNGEEYKSNRLQYPFFYANTEHKHQVDNNINKGKYTQALVNPHNPQQAVLSNELLGRDIVMTFIYVIGASIIFYTSIVLGIGTLLAN